MSYEKRSKKRRKRSIFTIIIFTVIIFLFFSSFFRLFQRNKKTILPEKMVLIDSISSQGFLIKNEYIVKAANEGVMELIAGEGERLAAGRKTVTINTLNNMESLEYELKEIEENISLLESEENQDEGIEIETDNHLINKEKLISDLQKKIFANEFSTITFIKEQLFLNDEEYKNVDFSKTSAGEGLKNLEDRKDKIEIELEQNHIKYYTNKAGIISYEIDGYEEIYLPSNFENYTYEKLKIGQLSKIVRDEKYKVLTDEPIYKIMDNFQWYVAMKIEDSKIISDFNENDNIRIYINDKEELSGNILAINNSGDKSVLIAKFNTMFHKYYNMRFPKVEIIKEKTNGFKIPKKSIVSVDNIIGVYIKDRSGIVRFRPVSIFKEDNNYAYVYSGDEKTNIYLNQTNEFMKTINLHDEILINPINIEEGDIL